MEIFKQTNGKEWKVQVNIASAMLIRARVKRRNGDPLDILKIVDIDPDQGKMGLLEEVVGDPLLLVEIIYSLLESQLTQQGITEEGFYASLSGDDLEVVTDLLMKELINFFPEAKKRVLRAIWEQVGIIQNQARGILASVFDAPDFKQRIAKATDGILSGDVQA